MSFLDLVLAEFRFVYADVLRRKSILLTFIAYPYILTVFILFLGSSIGSTQMFAEKLGVDPTVFFIVSGFLLMAILGVGDDLLWRPVFDEWTGTLPYIISSSSSRIKHYLAIPIPRLTLVLLSGSTSVLPVLVYRYGIQGLTEGFAVVGLTALASILMVSPMMVLIGAVYGVGGENWRVINVVRPLLLILVGAYYPRYLMPLAGRIVCYLIPSSHVVEAIQRILVETAGSLPDVLTLIGVATALFIAYSPVGVRSVSYWEERKVKEGVKT